MLSPSWFRRRRGRQLSALVDGELHGDELDRVAEDVVFDDDARRDLSDLRRTDALLAGAFTLDHAAPDAAAAANAVLARLPTAPEPVARRPWRPTVVASVVMSTGLLLTAGVAYGLRRSRS